jgi:P-type conjugative transfer protein TrbJ
MRRTHLIGVLLAAVLIAPGGARAQFAVTDIVAEAQTTETAIQTTAAVAKQVQQYEMQVQQYQNMLQNTAAPMTNIYRQVTADISGAQGALDGVTRLVPAGQPVSQYLSQFSGGGISSSIDFCGTQGLCTPSQFAAAQRAQVAAAQSRDAGLVSGSQTQLAALQSQAQDLQSIGDAAQGATGQMQALGYGNQIGTVAAGADLQIASILTQRMQQEAADRLVAQQALARTASANAAAGRAAINDLPSFYGPAPSGTYGQMAAGLPTIAP